MMSPGLIDQSLKQSSLLQSGHNDLLWYIEYSMLHRRIIEKTGRGTNSGGQRGQTLALTEIAHKQRNVPKKAASPSRPLQNGLTV